MLIDNRLHLQGALGTLPASLGYFLPGSFARTRDASQAKGATDTAAALGIEPAGVVQSWTEKPVYRYLRGKLGDPAFLGLETQPSLEDIAWLRPDLIVASSYRHDQILGLLAEIAPTAVQGTVYDFKSTLELMGRATGREERADALLCRWRARVTDFRHKVRRALGDQWPQEVAVVGFRADHARIYFSGFAGSILEQLGFRRPPNQRNSDRWGVKLTNKESIPALDAEVMFIIVDENDAAVARTFGRWQSHPLWQQLKAVQDGRAHRVAPTTWNLGGGVVAANHLLDDLYRLYSLEPMGEDSWSC